MGTPSPEPTPSPSPKPTPTPSPKPTPAPTPAPGGCPAAAVQCAHQPDPSQCHVQSYGPGTCGYMCGAQFCDAKCNCHANANEAARMLKEEAIPTTSAIIV